MRKSVILLAVAAVLIATSPFAASGKERRSKGAPSVRFEWGLTAGVNLPWIKSNIADDALHVSARTGFSAGFHAAIKFDRWIALQPEVLYTYTPIRVSDSATGFGARVRAQSVQVPIICSFRVWALRFNVGPVVTLMDNPTYRDKEGEKVMFGRVYPTLSYTAGVGVCIMQHLLIDLRYWGRFNKTTNHFSTDSAHEGREFRTSTRSVQLKIGYLF